MVSKKQIIISHPIADTGITTGGTYQATWMRRMLMYLWHEQE